MRLWKNVLWRDRRELRGTVCRLVWTDLTADEWATDAPGLTPQPTCG